MLVYHTVLVSEYQWILALKVGCYNLSISGGEEIHSADIRDASNFRATDGWFVFSLFLPLWCSAIWPLLSNSRMLLYCYFGLIGWLMNFVPGMVNYPGIFISTVNIYLHPERNDRECSNHLSIKVPSHLLVWLSLISQRCSSMFTVSCYSTV